MFARRIVKFLKRKPTLVLMTHVLVVFYSTYGHIAKLAKAMAEGAKEIEGVEVRIRRVAETLSDEILGKMGALEAQKAWHPEFEVVSHDDLLWADAIAWGSPTRFGNITAQMKTFMDTLGGIWAQGQLVGKIATAFTSSATQHGGQETTLVAGFYPFFAHQVHVANASGMVIVGLPYAFAGQMGVDEIKGGSPYGASTIAGGDGSRQPSDVELEGAKFQGRHAATLASDIKVGRDKKKRDERREKKNHEKKSKKSTEKTHEKSSSSKHTNHKEKKNKNKK